MKEVFDMEVHKSCVFSNKFTSNNKDPLIAEVNETLKKRKIDMSKSVIIKTCSSESNSDPESPHDFNLGDLDAIEEAVEKLFACGEDNVILKKIHHSEESYYYHKVLHVKISRLLQFTEQNIRYCKAVQKT